MPAHDQVNVAILDDYQGIALQMADWSILQGRAQLTVFRDHMFDLDTLVARLQPFDVLCVMRERTPLTRAILERLPNLKLIASTAPRNAAIDVAAAREQGVLVCGTGYVSHGTAELTWALILALVRRVPAEYTSVRQGGWQVSVGGDLEGKTLGILGLGRLGGRVARVAQAFGMQVTAWSQNLRHETAEEHGARLVDKQELFREADIVSVHLVLSPRTRGIVGAAELGLMKPTAYLVNTSRGPLVDEAALIDALQRHAIAGAALDTYDTEPLPTDHPLRSLDNVLTTPHIGFVTRETYEVFYRDTVENVSAWLDGHPLRVIEP